MDKVKEGSLREGFIPKRMNKVNLLNNFYKYVAKFYNSCSRMRISYNITESTSKMSGI